MESIYPEFALYGSKNENARTDTVFSPLSQVCNRGVTLNTNSCSNCQLLLAALQKIIPGSVLQDICFYNIFSSICLIIQRMQKLIILGKIESFAHCEGLTCKMGHVFILLGS